MAEIVNEADFLDGDNDVRIVRLYSAYGFDLYELYANLRHNRVILRRLSSEKPPKTATFSAIEMDALCDAWTQFKADRQAALDAEELRKAEVVKQAYALAASIDGLTIEASDDIEDRDYIQCSGWIVDVPDVNIARKSYRTPDGLLEGVQKIIQEWKASLEEAQTQLHSYQERLQGGDESKWIVERVKYNQQLLDTWGHVLEQMVRVA